MEEEKQKKLGVKIVNGRIIDLDNATSAEIGEEARKLEEKADEISMKISKILKEKNINARDITPLNNDDEFEK